MKPTTNIVSEPAAETASAPQSYARQGAGSLAAIGPVVGAASILPTDIITTKSGLTATLYLADCLDVLPGLVGVDAVITDPPYGIGAGEMNLGCWASSRVEPSAWDDCPPTLEALAAVVQAGTRSVLWGMNYFQLPQTRNYLVWDKGAGFKDRSFAECELAWCSWDGVARVLQRDPLAAGDYKDRTHKTQKPIAVMQWSLRHAEVALGSTILDPFMGSGTTGVAALRMGCNFIGVEIPDQYYQIAKRRIQAEADQGNLFQCENTKRPTPAHTVELPFGDD